MMNLAGTPLRALVSIVYGSGHLAPAGSTFFPVSEAERLEVLGLTRPGAIPVAEELDAREELTPSSPATSREEIGKILGLSASPIFGTVDPSDQPEPLQSSSGVDLRLGGGPAQMPPAPSPNPHDPMLRAALRERGQKPDFDPA